MNYKDRAEKAEEALRHIAFFLGVGGYNDAELEEFDVDKYVKRIKDGIMEDAIALEKLK